MGRKRSRPGTDQGNLFQDLALIPIEPIVEEPEILSMAEQKIRAEQKVRETEPLIYKGEKVLTFEQIDEIHGRTPGTAKGAFHRRRGRIHEDHDYFRVTAEDFSGIKFIPEKNPRDRIVLTEWGYHLVIRTFNDELSWEIYRIVLRGYFKSKHLQTNEDLKTYIDSRIEEKEKSFLQIVKIRIVDPILEAMHRQFSETKAMVSEVQHRKEPTAATQDELLQVLLGSAYDGKCPCCMRTRILDQDGNAMDSLNFDHWYRITRNAPWEMWPVCDKCNLDLRDQRFHESHETYFKSFQRRREEMLEGRKPTLPFDGK